jgi:hypothetical protein
MSLHKHHEMYMVAPVMAAKARFRRIDPPEKRNGLGGVVIRSIFRMIDPAKAQ